MRKTADEYKKSYYNKIKKSHSIEKLSDWKLDNGDESFDAKQYSENLDSFLDDIVQSIDNIGSKKSDG